LSKSDYWESAILNHELRGVALPTLPASVYVSLHTADPGETGANELVIATHAWYGRVGVTRATGSWTAATTGVASSAVAVTYAAPTTTVAATHFGIWDAVTAGNYLRGGALGATANLASGQTAPSFASGAITVTEG